MSVDIVYNIVVGLVGLLLSARLGLGLLMQSGRMKIVFPLLILVYVSLGFCLGSISESKTIQQWMYWILEGDRVMMLQAGEVVLCFVVVFLSLSFLRSMEGGMKSRGKFSLLSPLLMAPSPLIGIWMIFSVGSVQMTLAGWKGYHLGIGIAGALLLFVSLVWLAGKLTHLSGFLIVFGFILLEIVLTVLVVFLPVAVNLPAFETTGFSVPSGKTVLVLGSIILIIGTGYLLSYKTVKISEYT